MSQPAVSVAMSVYNNEPFLAPAIESILAQTFTDYELLILNDGSTDASAAIIDGFAAKDARIRAIHRENRGLIVSLNELIEAARARLIARMDGDDIALPDRFARQIAEFQRRPGLGVLGTGADCIDENGQPHPKNFSNVTTHEEIVEDLQNGPPVCHPSVMMRSDAVRAVGGYHRAYRHCEDYDLWLRLSETTIMMNLPDRLMLYRQSAGQVSNRHTLAQHVGAAIAWEAHAERLAGRPDPTADLETLPPVGELDALFGRKGVTRDVRAKVARTIVYSPDALRDGGLDLLIGHIGVGGAKDGLWRTVGRLLTQHEPALAFRLGAALAMPR